MTPASRAAASTFRSTVSSLLVGAVRPGSQLDVMRTAVNPASRNCVIFALRRDEIRRSDDVLGRAERHRRSRGLRRKREREERGKRADQGDERRSKVGVR